MMPELTEAEARAENAKILAHSKKMQEAMRNLRENPHFLFFMQYLQEQLDLRMVEVLQMPESADDVIKRTYVAGELATFKVVIGLQEVLYETSKQQLQQSLAYEEHFMEQEKYENAEDTDDE